MNRAKLTSKGQITIPVEVREAMGLAPGASVIFFEVDDGAFVVRRMKSIMELEGCLAGYKVPKNDEELNQSLHQRAATLDAATKSDAEHISDGAAA